MGAKVTGGLPQTLAPADEEAAHWRAAGMATTTLAQRRYDRRLRDLIRSTQDVDCAIQRGVPLSTARSWLTEPSAEVVTTDVLNMDALQLQQEVLRLG